MIFSNDLKKLVGGILLVAGTSIGAGMLALPVLTYSVGFIPSLILIACCWLIMLFSGLTILKLFLDHPQAKNFLSLTENTLGKPARLSVWFVYLALFYSLLIAYNAALGQLIPLIISCDLSSELSIGIFIPILGWIIYRGTTYVDKLNRWLMLGLITTYCSFVILGASHVKAERLQTVDWSMSLVSLPIILSSFGYQPIIPSLIPYLKKKKLLYYAIVLGSFIPCFIYAIWQWLILGVVPVDGEVSLSSALHNQQNVLNAFQIGVNNDWVVWIGRYFAIFAVITSFLGVGISFIDFLIDGFKKIPLKSPRAVASLICFLPPMGMAICNASLFFIALQYGAIICVFYLYGVIPFLIWLRKFKT